jgi:hypothetical protein
VLDKIIYATVVYECNSFDTFAHDYLESVFKQTDQNFELLILSDDVDLANIKGVVDQFNLNKKKIHYEKSARRLTPIQLRKELVDISYKLGADVLIFSDFDESVANNRVEEILSNIGNYDFVFNDFFVVDKQLNKIEENSFFETRNIPNHLLDWREIKLFNYVGLGSMAINLSSYDYKSMIIPDYIVAVDWFIATKVLVDGGIGMKITNTFANYRQHDNSFVGFEFSLNRERLAQGLKVKEGHYKYFKEYNQEFNFLYTGILELRDYINKVGEDYYINEVNSRFNMNDFCWWENIKLKKEINYDL